MHLYLSLALAITAANAPVQVDEGVTEVRTCRISALAFRTASDGWMFDHCGAAFRSSDGGRSWRTAPEIERQLFGVINLGNPGTLFRPYIQHALWLSESTGLVFAYGVQSVFRTEDAGRTWNAAALPPAGGSEMIYGVDHIRDRVWFCGSTGRVSRSTDAGRTSIAGPQLFEEAAVNPTNWCTALSFLDANDGWAAGWRALWRTIDGGVTWTELPPVLAPGALAPSTEVVRGMVRLSPMVAWARTEGSARLRTQDGGRRWSQVAFPEPRPGVARRTDGRALVVATDVPTGGRIEDVVPMVDDSWVAVGPDGAMNADLAVYAGGALARGGPPVTPPSGRTVILQGRTAAHGAEWGWAGTTVFRTDDAGRTWRRVGALPAPAARLAAVSNRQVLGRAGTDLYRSDDGGRTWTMATDVAVRADWARLTGEENTGPRPHESLECALRGPARLTVDFGTQGCFGGTEHSLSLTVAAGGAGHLKGALQQWDKSAKRFVPRLVDQALSRKEAEGAVRQLASAIARLEVPSGCQSTERIFARLAWTCGQSPPQTLEYETHDCSPQILDSVAAQTRSRLQDGDGYARAAGLRAIAESLLRQQLPR